MPSGRDPKVVSELSQLIRQRVAREILSSAEPQPGEKPEGIVTIVFTDIEESSALVTALGDERARALIRQHDELLRAAVRDHGGVEVERAGDGFMVAFSTASRAVQFAIALQRGLAERPDAESSGVRVRIGMETGEVIAEEQGYFGGTVFRAARIVEQARGGQILASHPTALIAGHEGFSLTDLGEHDLKGFGPQRLFEIEWPADSPN
jgi:class 3 adenylate cyclase